MEKNYELINYVCQPWIERPVFVPRYWTLYNTTDRFSHIKARFRLLCHSF